MCVCMVGGGNEVDINLFTMVEKSRKHWIFNDSMKFKVGDFYTKEKN